MNTPLDSQHIHDVVGIGFGPSNLAVAIQCEERNINNIKFIEKMPSFTWHEDLLLDTSLLQVPFLKDLVTLTNTKSYYTFLSYLQEKGRLNEFINLRKFFPSRIEFADYYEWAASKFTCVDYKISAQSITKFKRIKSDKYLFKINCFCHTTNKSIEYIARNVIISDGGKKRLPSNVIQ